MAVNPLEDDLKKANSDLHDLYRRRDNLRKERSWFQNTDPSVLASTIQSLEANRKESEDARQDVTSQINRIQEEIERLPIKSMFNPMNWFDPEQRNFRRQRKTSLQAEHELGQQLQSIDKRLGSIREEIRSKTDELRRYHAFEKDDKELPTKIPEKEKEVNRIRKHKERIDRVQEKPLAQIKKYEEEIKDFQRKKHKAQEYESRLGSAGSKFARVKIHDECEAELGNRSPSALVREYGTELNRCKRGKQKTEEQLRFETQRLYSQDIQEIVIDGNNLCYTEEAGEDKFVGLAILDKLIPLLLQDYDVTLFFDPWICRQVKLKEQAIKKRYAPATVQIVPKAERRGADPTIVKYASNDKYAYVLTKDQYMDFREYPVFKENRLIRSQAIKNTLIINDLDVNLQF